MAYSWRQTFPEANIPAWLEAIALEDSSWGNDQCASLVLRFHPNGEYAARVWIDEQGGEFERFAIGTYDEEGEGADTPFATDSESELRAWLEGWLPTEQKAKLLAFWSTGIFKRDPRTQDYCYPELVAAYNAGHAQRGA